MKKNKIEEYGQVITSMIAENIEAQADTLAKLAEIWAETIKNNHMTYVFGSGHSRFIAGELYWRAGGLASVLQIEDTAGGAAERLEGYAATFMHTYNILPGDMLIVISNSGINPLPLEVAMIGKEMGAKVIALTSVEYSQSAKSRHSSGKKLFEIADIVIDSGNVRGDALIGIDGLPGWRVAPASTAIGVTLLDALVAQTAQNLADSGVKPPVLLSANIAEGDEHNKALRDQYWPKLTRFPRKDVF